MNCHYLLSRAKEKLEKHPRYIRGKINARLFSEGAEWMHDWLNETDKAQRFNTDINYEMYGLLKYGSCVAAFLTTAVFFYRVHISLTPISIIVFYFFEVQFLFLFPLLIDGIDHPVYTSMRQTYRIGIIKVMCTVVPISIFMIFGLFNIKAPYRNWHIGSLAIIIWYQHEIRNRIQSLRSKD